MSKWINFKLVGEKPKTKIWMVTSNENEDELGIIEWLPRWRKYCFYPSDSVFEEDCLRDIADFIEMKTKNHKRKRNE